MDVMIFASFLYSRQFKIEVTYSELLRSERFAKKIKQTQTHLHFTLDKINLLFYQFMINLYE